MVVMTLYGVRTCSSLPVFPGRESELFYNDSSESPRDHSFPAMCSSEMSSAACVGSLKGIAAGQLQLHWLRNPEMWVKTVSAAVTFDPLLQGGGGSRRLQVRALDRRASQQMVAPTNHKHCQGRGGRLGPCVGSSPSSMVCICARTAAKEFTSVLS